MKDPEFVTNLGIYVKMGRIKYTIIITFIFV